MNIWFIPTSFLIRPMAKIFNISRFNGNILYQQLPRYWSLTWIWDFNQTFVPEMAMTQKYGTNSAAIIAAIRSQGSGCVEECMSTEIDLIPGSPEDNDVSHQNFFLILSPFNGY